MLTQIELERRMYGSGRAKANKIMDANEEQGRASNNPYGGVLYSRFVQPLAAAVREDLASGSAGRYKAHISLLAPLDPEVVALVTVRAVINDLMNSSNRGHTARTTVNAVGRAVYGELVLRLFEHINPALFYTLTTDLNRRKSKDERHKIAVFKNKAKEAGVTFPEWGPTGTTQVGAYLVDRLEHLGMVQTVRSTGTRRNRIDLQMSDAVAQLIDTVVEMTRETMPYFLPCVEAPKDWTAIDEGGWHTDEMRRMQPYAVANPGAWKGVQDQKASVPLRAINALQRTPWQINTRVLDAVKEVSKHFDMGEIVGQAENPAPARPQFLEGDLKVDQMSAQQLEAFTAWKRQKREWHTQNKLRRSEQNRFATCMRVSEEYREYPEIFFVHFADFRGRLYAKTLGVSPQGSDLQRGLIRFARGKALNDLKAELWFVCHGANRWGYDKTSLEDRAAWVKERDVMIRSFAQDPISNTGWMEADKPVQFLAWAMEYDQWRTSPHDFISHIPVAMDGTCNGLQNFSAMLRDEVGGKATNLLPGEKPRDIYQEVADVAAFKLRQSTPDEAGYRDKWLDHGINRSLVKRSVMTRPYGSTRFSCSDFIVEDYLRVGKAPAFAKEEYSKAATFLSYFVWDAIAEVVVKASEAMEYLQRASTKIFADGASRVTWTSPSGFPVTQAYQKCTSHRINSKLCGNAKLRVNVETDEPDKAKHRNGIAPNFIHSYDAAHLHLTTVAAASEAMDLAMIHDDYGTHAADADRLARTIRESFVTMYEGCQPLQELADRYDLPPPPVPGSLDIRQVLDSKYFFA
jgi:DNA-directed RNA polymerase